MNNKLPTKMGDPLYAVQDGVYIFEKADINSSKLGNFYTKGDLIYAKNDFVGTYTGEKNGSFYQVTVTFRTKNLWPFNRTITVNGWVLSNQITTDSKEDIAQQDDDKKDDDLKKYLADITGDSGTKKGLTGSGTGEGDENPVNSTTNIVLGVAIITAIGLIIAGFIKRTSKAKK